MRVKFDVERLILTLKGASNEELVCAVATGGRGSADHRFGGFDYKQTNQRFAQGRSSYAEDRAAIEDLQARYLFALDFHDPDLYVSTFAEDGVLDYGSGEVKGRQAIKTVIAGMPNPKQVPGKRAGAARHNISNDVIKVDGNTASSRSYWFHYSNDNPERRGVFDGFGHYEDNLVKVNGGWLFTKRKIYNEGRDEWAYKGTKNPAW